MLQSCFVLLLFQLAGEVLAASAHIPMPGPVLGMMLLAAWYTVRRRGPGEEMVRASNSLLGWLGLFFVPAGAGVFASLALLRAQWLPVSVALAGSTLLTLIVTAGVMNRLSRSGR